MSAICIAATVIFRLRSISAEPGANLTERSFLYDPTVGTTIDIVDPETGPGSGYMSSSSLFGYTEAFDINNFGQVVGRTITTIQSGVYQPTGFVPDLATGLYATLNDPSFTAVSTVPLGIDTAGRIVGTYTDPSRVISDIRR